MSDKQRSHVVEQTSRNIDLAFQLLDEAIANDEVFDQIPDGETLVLLPYDDPKLALQNLATAHRLASNGKTVYLRLFGAPPESRLDLYARYVSPASLRLAAPLELAGPLSIEYDPIAGAEVFDLSGGQRSTFRVPISAGLALLVDLNSQVVVGYSVPEAFVANLRSFRQEVVKGWYASDHGLPLHTSAAMATFIEDLAPAAA